MGKQWQAKNNAKARIAGTGGAGRRELVMGRDREGAHGGTGKWGKMNGAGDGEKRKGT